MEQAATLYEDRGMDSDEYNKAIKNLGFLLEANAQLGIVKAIRSYRLSDKDNLLLMVF